ncbi:MAG: glutamate-1-semialdehyde 2,1-aminomutase, partial [Omnitrophica bacterium]|nr:glutamate-1-semialdehyde 2,1-aminomutase [Candidatus Omnitrophota bacterium]
DYCLSWGVLILGHAYPRVTEALLRVVKEGTSFGTVTKPETELARLIVEAVPSIEQVRLTNSGTEAVMSAVRLARAFRGRKKIIKFEGAYHGHADYLLSKAGSGLATLGVPDSAGVPQDFTAHTLTCPFNDIEAVRGIAERYRKDLAAIIVEPVAANCGVIMPQAGFLEGLRNVADKYGAQLIFDEVITGFRVSYSGAQGFFGVMPDLTCLGKIIGGGLPVGAFGGRKEIMELLAPLGDVYQAGTLAGNPVAVRAGIETLKALKETNPYRALEEKTKKLCEGIKNTGKNSGLSIKVNSIASIFSIFFARNDVRNYKTAKAQDTGLFKRFYHGLIKQGIYLSPSGFEANFLSTEHSGGDIEKTLKAVDCAMKNIGGN